MIEWHIHGGVLKFEESTHTYWFNDVECISATEVVKLKFPNLYKDVSESVLKKRAEYGTMVHNCIEVYEKFGLESKEVVEFRNYLFLKNYFKFKVIENEIPIVYEYRGVYIVGRLDMVVTDEEGLCVVDIKTTNALHKECLEVQLMVYKKGYEQTYGKQIHGLRALHLRDTKNNYVKINQTFDLDNFIDKLIETNENARKYFERKNYEPYNVTVKFENGEVYGYQDVYYVGESNEFKFVDANNGVYSIVSYSNVEEIKKKAKKLDCDELSVLGLRVIENVYGNIVYIESKKNIGEKYKLDEFVDVTKLYKGEKNETI